MANILNYLLMTMICVELVFQLEFALDLDSLNLTKKSVNCSDIWVMYNFF
jgi:hypothetical protein